MGAAGIASGLFFGSILDQLVICEVGSSQDLEGLEGQEEEARVEAEGLVDGCEEATPLILWRHKVPGCQETCSHEHEFEAPAAIVEVRSYGCARGRYQEDKSVEYEQYQGQS